MQSAAGRDWMVPVRKEWLVLGGQTLLDRVVDTVAAETSRTLVVVAPGRPLPPLTRAVEVVHDTAPGSGPLAAILDGLAAIGPAAEDPLVVVASCDIPLVKREAVRLLVGRAATTSADWVVPTVAGHPQVLFSVMRRSLTGPIVGWLAAGRRDPRGLLSAMLTRSGLRVRMLEAAEFAGVDPHLESFRDVDTPEDLAAIAHQLPYGDRGGGAYTPRP